MSASEHPPPDGHGRRGGEPSLGDGFRRLAKAAGEQAARAAERARRANARLRRLRTGLPDAIDAPVPRPLRAALDHALSYQVLAGVHEQAAGHFLARAARGVGDVEGCHERAAWHNDAADRARRAGLAWAKGARSGTGHPSGPGQ
ncbi:hypothetical protein ACWEPC_43395 [Nonomuraea sp. NPDC004297]